ncbi:Hypothetical predicted protein, partial [Pelobates cultripes]
TNLEQKLLALQKAQTQDQDRTAAMEDKRHWKNSKYVVCLKISRLLSLPTYI